MIGKLARSTKREIEDALEPGAGQSLLDRLTVLEEQVQLLTKGDTYDENNPIDCLRAAVDRMKRAASLCNFACGALADGDHPTTGKVRSTLLEFRSRLNTMAHVIEHRELADKLKEESTNG